jgi:hypothetical protein
MRAVVLSIVILFIVLVITACHHDYGKCLQSHVEHRPARMWIQVMIIGGHSYPVVHNVRAHDVTVCDRYEFPEGR